MPGQALDRAATVRNMRYHQVGHDRRHGWGKGASASEGESIIGGKGINRPGVLLADPLSLRFCYTPTGGRVKPVEACSPAVLSRRPAIVPPPASPDGVCLGPCAAADRLTSRQNCSGQPCYPVGLWCVLMRRPIPSLGCQELRARHWLEP